VPVEVAPWTAILMMSMTRSMLTVAAIDHRTAKINIAGDKGVGGGRDPGDLRNI
jgi:hypothetical protein